MGPVRVLVNLEIRVVLHLKFEKDTHFISHPFGKESNAQGSIGIMILLDQLHVLEFNTREKGYTLDKEELSKHVHGVFL